MSRYRPFSQFRKSSGKKRARRRMFSEQLEDRRLLVAATDLASIVGLVSISGNSGSVPVASAALDLYRDDGDGIFEPGADDAEVSMTMTDSSGNYRFDNLTVGNYFVLQSAQTVAGGQSIQRQVSPRLSVSSDDVLGQVRRTIDSFDVTTQSVSDDTDTNPVVAIAVAPTTEVIGGERELIVNKTSADGILEADVNNAALPGRYAFSAQFQGAGSQTIVWDGADNDATLVDDTGLGPVDLTLDARGIQLQIRADNGGVARLRVYSDDGVSGTATRYSEVTMPIPATPDNSLSPEFISFTDGFTSSSGGGADFTSVGAIELVITQPADVDGLSRLIGVVGNTEQVFNFANTQSADLSLTKTVDDSSPDVNQNVTFTIRVDNSGPDNATGVQVTDLLPAGIEFVSISPSTANYMPATGIWDVGTISSGGFQTLSITGRVTSTGTRENFARVTASDQPDPDSNLATNVITDDDEASVMIETLAIDLELSKTPSTFTPNVGESIAFTLTLFNRGPSVATNVQVQDVLPSGLTLNDADPGAGTSFNTTSGIWTVPSLAAGSSIQLVLNTTVGNQVSIVNTAEVIAADQVDSDSQPNTGNDGQDDFASVTLTPPRADLEVSKVLVNSSDATPNVGDEISFLVTIFNRGPSQATNVVVSDVLPTGLSSSGATTDAGVYTAATGRWEVGTLEPDTSRTLTIRAIVETPASTTNTTLSNTARVLSVDQFDPDSTAGNNVESEDDQQTITVTPQVIDLLLEKSVSPALADVGDEVTYTLILTNEFGDTATNIQVQDDLPSGVTFLESTPASANYNPTTGVWTVSSLDAGQSMTLNLRGRIDSAIDTSNTAEVIAVDQFDRDSTPANNVDGEDDRATATFAIASADLSLTKTVNTESPNVGENVTFTIRVVNDGPNPATGVSVRDILPAGTTFVSTSDATNYDSSSGIWDVGSVAVGNANAEMLTIVATATTDNVVINSAEIIAADQADPDSKPGDGTGDDFAQAQLQGQQVDLRLFKTISNSQPNVGSEVTFQIRVLNESDSLATGVQVTDILPSGLELVSSAPSQGSFNTTTGVWTVGTLAGGTDETLDLTVRVTQVLGETVNVAEISAADQPDIDSVPGSGDDGQDDFASVTFSTPVADLELTKTVSQSDPNVGDVVTFTIDLENVGPDDATGVTVLDLLPTGVQFVSTSLSAGTYNDTTGIWDLGTLAANATARLSIRATVVTQGTKTNVARVQTSDQADPDSQPGDDVLSQDDQGQVSITPPVIDLSIDKTALPIRPSVGGEVTFTIQVSNSQPSNATGVVVTDLLPANLTFVSSNPTTGSYDAPSGRWTVGTVAGNDSETLTITARVNQFGAITNTAEVTSANQFDIDSVPGDNIESDDDQDTITLTPASADLSIAKSVNDAEPDVGDEVTFVVTLSNDGPDDASDIVVRDNLPAGLTIISSAPQSGTSFDITNGRWNVPLLRSGQSVALTIVMRVDSVGDKTNRVEVIQSSEFDPDSEPNDGQGDDYAEATLSPQLVDLALQKIIDDDRPNVGDSVEYLLTLTNSGPSAATGVVVTDQLPNGVLFDNAIVSQGAYDAATGLWTVGQVEDGGTATLRLVATVGNVRSAINRAEVTAVDQVDLDSTPGNGVAAEDDDAQVALETQVADLRLTKTVNNASPGQQENVTFRLTLTNDGPDAATEVVVRDVLPVGLTFVSADPSTGSYDPVTGFWSLANVPNNASVTLDIVAGVSLATSLTNVAEVFASRQFDPDSTPGDSVTTQDDYAAVVVTPLIVDITVSATADNLTPVEDDVITIVFTAENEGTTGASGLVASVLIPTGLTILSAVPSRGVYDPITGRWEIGTLANATSSTLTVTARVDQRGFRELPIEIIQLDQFDVDSVPGNGAEEEDDQETLVLTAPKVLSKRLFLSR
ncbi:Large cysteine-rich periplasmic protein omcB precursor [Rubripirellula amarantea]|uniref:Large cysteine-rich periplasmic protein omcB n=1 Tax=Rubripirellula amarantea TaxID=2527999 RepID=A0A5C5WV99_9BACT|nr:DUF11 domain-containing protein [Rubripirellula amarantea]TWT53953.1 Large cysteine-rich periplasmic protein omcB precursor [Rubripirellula amarantea]